uniref:Matrix protein n=1 Tax=Duck rhabdovirus TaxID=2212761 RepID=A0A3G1RP92_9RHAB|nr:MAG: matrix protein [Duck rhabdovirus]
MKKMSRVQERVPSIVSVRGRVSAINKGSSLVRVDRRATAPQKHLEPIPLPKHGDVDLSKCPKEIDHSPKSVVTTTLHLDCQISFVGLGQSLSESDQIAFYKMWKDEQLNFPDLWPIASYCLVIALLRMPYAFKHKDFRFALFDDYILTFSNQVAVPKTPSYYDFQKRFRIGRENFVFTMHLVINKSYRVGTYLHKESSVRTVGNFFLAAGESNIRWKDKDYFWDH